jgi:hypothetical protein
MAKPLHANPSGDTRIFDDDAEATLEVYAPTACPTHPTAANGRERVGGGRGIGRRRENRGCHVRGRGSPFWYPSAGDFEEAARPRKAPTHV